MLEITNDIFRNSSLQWEDTIGDVPKILDSCGLGAHIAVCGKHGMGKSTFLAFAAQIPGLLAIESDQLITYGYGRYLSLSPATKLCDVPNPWDAQKSGKAPDNIFRWESYEPLLRRVDFISNFSAWARYTFAMCPEPAAYRSRLRERTAVMLKDPRWEGSTPDRWPELDDEGICNYIRRISSVPNFIGFIPNTNSNDVNAVVWGSLIRAYWRTA